MIPKIAIVDDEKSNLEMIRAILEKKPPPPAENIFSDGQIESREVEQTAEYSIFLFDDPERAKLVLQEAHDQNTPFALLITDLRMPTRDGLWMVRQARQIDETLRVIIFTSYPEVSIEELNEAAGGKNFIYLEKSVPPTVISQAVLSELTNWRQAKEDRRREARFNVTKPLTLHFPRGLPATSIDMAGSGLGIMALPRKIEIASNVEIVLEGIPVPKKGIVRWIEENTENWYLGIQFESSDEPQ